MNGDLLHAGLAGELELRRSGGSTTLAGSFPYNSVAVLSDGGRRGRPMKETFAERAFAYNVESKDAEIRLLVGHDFSKPLAAKLAGTLILKDTKRALEFTARISPEVAATSHARDALALIGAGLATGISPGFRIPPARTVPDAEVVTEEPDDPENGMHRAIIRTIKQALLFELSIVTAPAYDDAQVEARNWNPGGRAAPAAPAHLRRYRL